MSHINEIHKVSKQEKMRILESITQTNERSVINKIISLLDDPDIEIRGEVFSTLVLNKNNISEILIEKLKDNSKNVRAYTALILANRKDLNSIESLIKLTSDERSVVRSCALGALGYLKANNAKKVIHDCFKDENIEVKKSALKASIDIGDKISTEELKSFSKEKDNELNRLVLIANQKNGGPEGI